MGGGSWSPKTYSDSDDKRRASGKSAFDYSDTMASKPRDEQKPHPTLDITLKPYRESRDSAEHPESNAVTVWFDHTGSMSEVPRIMQKSLPQLLGTLLRNGYLTDPQIQFACVGDATCDSVPLSVGEFESDNTMDQNLGNFVLEGGGGGTYEESYDLAFFIAARLVKMDCYEKRGKKGYLFIIGDEKARNVSRSLVSRFIGVGLQDDIPLDVIIEEAKKMYNIFFIIPKSTNHGDDPVLLKFWRKYFGQNVLQVADTESIPALIAATIGTMEGADDVAQDLIDAGTPRLIADTVTKALAPLAGGAVTKGSGGNLPGLKPDADSKTRRL